MSGVTLTVKHQDGFTPFFDALKSKLGVASIALMMDTTGAALESDVTQRFLDGTEPDGTPWLPSQRALEQNGKTLIDSSILMSSMSHEVSGNGVLVGTNEVYAAIHHFGGEAGRNKSVTIPQRRIFGIDVPQQALIDEIWTGWLQ